MPNIVELISKFRKRKKVNNYTYQKEPDVMKKEMPINVLNQDENNGETNEEYEVVEREILPNKIICPDCGGITLEGLEFCDKCGGLLQ